ncbi:hypothetical protein FOA52_006103 [Chlamydomonas sp. UWO 241]|nr:hypothetical protein FOA52_006103 [Chlamydomonas sp. UWO 241]
MRVAPAGTAAAACMVPHGGGLGLLFPHAPVRTASLRGCSTMRRVQLCVEARAGGAGGGSRSLQPGGRSSGGRSSGGGRSSWSEFSSGGGDGGSSREGPRPPVPVKGISRTQRSLLSDLDGLRGGKEASGVDGDSASGEQRPRRWGSGGGEEARGGRGRGGRGDARGSRGEARGGRGDGERAARSASTNGPDEFVVIKFPSRSDAPPPASARGTNPVGRTARAEDEGEDEEDDSALDGARFWAEKSGWGEPEEGEDEDEDGEMDEDEEEEIGDADDGQPTGLLLAPQPSPSPPETDAQAALRALYTTSGALSPRSVDERVQFRPVRGRGRGLVATADVPAGTLLVCSVPLAVVWCDEGDTPENEELADHMMSKVKLTPPQQGLLSWMHNGRQSGGPPNGTHALMEAAFSAALLPGTKSGLAGIEKQALYDIVNTNCMGEEFQDIASCALRGEGPLGHIGVWPEVAMVNHSCAPNATCLTLGDRLLVRASEDIPLGTEVTLNWVGALITAPLQQRRSELQDKYKFKCECRRCKVEAGLVGTPVEAALNAAHGACEGLTERLEGAIKENDRGALLKASAELDSLRESFEGAVREAKVTSKVKAWLQASAYDLYDLTSLAADEGAYADVPIGKAKGGKAAGGRGFGGPGRGFGAPGRGGGRGQQQQAEVEEVEEVLDTERLAWCVRILSSVTRGADAHVYLSAELMMRTINRFGEGHQEAGAAIAVCKDSYRARYGPISDALFEELASARLSV